MPEADSPKAPSPAVDRAFTVLETLVESEEPLTLTAIAKATGIPLATCAAIMQTLEQRGYAARRIVGRSHFWRPTLRLYGLATALVRKVDLASVAQPYLRTLADELSMPAHLGVLEGNTVVYVAKAATPGFIQFNTFPGKVAPYNLTALGKAIVAYHAQDEIDALMPHRVPGRGPKAQRVKAAAFREELAGIREVGYAVEDEEDEADIACVAAPVLDGSGKAIAAVGVTGFAKELAGARRDEAVAAVLEVGRILSERLGHAIQRV